MSTMPSREREALRTWFERSATRRGRTVSIDPLPGDASSRRYYRIRVRGDSFVGMRVPPFQDVGEQLPFIQVQKHLHKLGVSVPQIFDIDARRGLILLSDLGDETLLKRLERVSKKRDQLIWFKRAIDLMLAMQISATRNTTPIDAYGLYFDEEKLMWEVAFTFAHFYGGYLARNIPGKELKLLEAYFQWICKQLASREWYFTHRDYHSRNIMIAGSDLYMIDFQDARLGCSQYDLASLLRDSYYQLDDDVVYELVEYYLDRKEKIEGRRENRREYARVFDLMSIQRNFKAIGSFASFYMKRQDVRYLKFIGNTFENIRKNLLKFSELDELRCLLYRYYYF
ncbi:MAG: phosphotransferase [Deltaproteobacteria bacterium]|nr:phosphotransferase [Deltaproteobacteria bacterium]